MLVIFIASPQKESKHAHYLHDGNAIGFALDSMGGISKSAKDLIDHLYARGEQEKRRRWDSETMRVALKKEFMDRLSMVLCIHRVLRDVPSSEHYFALKFRMRLKIHKIH